MARETKLNNMLSEEDEKRSSKRRSVSSEIKREASKELARRKREDKQKQKRIKKLRKNRKDGIPEQVFDVEMPESEQKQFVNVSEEQVAPKVEPAIVKEEGASSKTSHIDFAELKKAQEELRKEQGFEEPEIDYSYKKIVDDEGEPSGQDELSLNNPYAEKQVPNSFSFVPEDYSNSQEVNNAELPDEDENSTPFAFDFSHIKVPEHLKNKNIQVEQINEEDSIASKKIEDNDEGVENQVVETPTEEVNNEVEEPKHNVNVTMADGSPVPSNVNLNISINIPEGVKSSETVIRHEGDVDNTNVNISGNGDADVDDTKKALAEFGVFDDITKNEPVGDSVENNVVDETSQTENVAPIDEKETIEKVNDVKSETEDLSTAESFAAIEPKVEEPKELPDEYLGNDHVSRISNDEIEAMKRQIAFERGEITEEEYLAGPNNVNKPEPEVATEKEVQEEQSGEEASQESAQQEEEEEENKALDAIKKAARRKEDDMIAPEESLPDSITDEDIEEHFQAQEKEEQKKQEEEDSAEYKGMTEEEIALAKERKRKLQELKARYNTKENSQSDGDGDYRKNLDFSINTSIKRFRVKPPKKPIIIAVASVLALFLVVGVIAYFILNKPPAPVVMSSVSLSQTYTYQYVGDELDIRGIYADCHYSNGTTRKVKLTKEMISRKSLNINEHNIILDYDDLDFEIPEGTNKSTFVYFTVNGFEAKLDIRITELNFESISAELVGQYFMVSDVVSFDNFLILGKTTSDKYVRINAKDCQLTINGLVIQSNDDGFIIPGDYKGTHELLISYAYNNTMLTTTISITIKES